MTFITIFTFIQIAVIITLFVLVIYTLLLAIKALRIYIRKNS
ncbi:MAG: hypothetical protein K0R34_1650 [Herbinix sp.]|jgi:hypothetical protein|nr:hypothetical protein [Herbinix sp.]